MKFIISENRLGNLIQKYISSYVGEELNPDRTIVVTNWYDKNGNRRFKTLLVKDDSELGVDYNMWVSVKDMFSILDLSYIDYNFIVWFNNHQNIIEMKPSYTKVYTDYFTGMR
jgi:hypothetical protein